MHLIKYIKANQRNSDGTYLVTEDQLYLIRKQNVELRRMSFRLMIAFEVLSHRYLIPTLWNKPYLSIKRYFLEGKAN